MLVASALLDALGALDRERPFARKLFVVPDVNFGRELLLAHARRTGGWVGWDVVTLRGVADELAFVAMGAAGRRAGNDVELVTLVDRALDDAITVGAVDQRFGALSGGLGFRRAVQDAVLELRTAGIAPERLRDSSPKGSPAHDLAGVLARYEALLEASRLTDPAGVFHLALAEFDAQAPVALGGTIALAPDLKTGGLPGRLVERMLGAGARPLAADAVVGLVAPERSLDVLVAGRALEPWPAAEPAASLLAWLAAPASLPPAGDPAAPRAGAVELELFAAATPTDEVREALRRAVAEGCRWDEIELVATDPDAYGIALDAVCRQLGMEYSALHGLPLARTRLGRALSRWFDWLADGLPADTIREALEAGDLRAPDTGADTAPPQLARMLRALGIGWGRARWVAALEELRDPEHATGVSRREDESDEEREERVARRRRTGAALAGLLAMLLELVPDAPERGADRPVRSSAAALARATLGFLELVPVHGMGERQTLARLRTRLGHLADTAPVETRFQAALAQVRDALADVRAWTTTESDRKPWSSAGGIPHLTDLAHAGTTGRPRVFVLGLDADRVAGTRTQDPILTDAVRLALESDGLPTTAARRQERAWSVGRALARLRGRVSFSWAVGGDGSERLAGPAHLVLEALRLLRRAPTLTYDDLRAHLGAPVCAVPPAERALDARDVWLASLADGPLLLDGTDAVRAAWADLDAALRAREARFGAEGIEHHGLVPAAAGALDPRATGRPMSASSLETLAKCPLAWFYRYGVRLQPPGDAEYDAEQWLDAMERGSLLHALYERLTEEYRGRQAALLEEAARERTLGLAEEVLREWEAKVPPPSAAVFDSEAAEVRASAVAFLEFEREAVRSRGAGQWEAFELDLAQPEPTAIPLDGGGTLRVVGFVDRLDRLPSGELVVIDYKTGSPYSYLQQKKDAPFKGGRRLQAAVYASAVETRGIGTVARFEYRFPTRKGENQAVVYDRPQIARAGALLTGLLDHVRHGHFVPTDDSGDCGYCDFQQICRAAKGTYGTTSPRAEWAAEHGPAHPAFGTMIQRRTPEAP